MLLIVNLPGYENIEVQLNNEGEIQTANLCCSKSTLDLFKNNIHAFGKKIKFWPLSKLNDTHLGSKKFDRRARLLIQELILKAKGEWKIPYEGEVVCTCRDVSCEKISHAITARAKSLEEVSIWTTASTSCTTCKDKVEEILTYRTK